MSLTAAERLQLAMAVPGYGTTVSIEQALTQVDAAYAAAYPDPAPASPAQLATTVLATVTNALPNGVTQVLRFYADGHKTSVAPDGTETLIVPAPAAATTS